MEGVAPDGRPTLHLLERSEWRSWLTEHSQSSSGVWFVAFKRSTGRPRIEYDDMVEEGLCFGWIDSKAGTLDAERSMVWMSPRRAKSGWSGLNKRRIEALEAAGLMTEAGRRMVELARATGTWDLLTDVENLVIPDDLASAFERVPEARRRWDGFSRSARQGVLGWIVQAKRLETRANRIEETVRLAALGEVANTWKPKTEP
jgi:uncharacterized protein YdeI (YjbR/CyaY-like superfamily)